MDFASNFRSFGESAIFGDVRSAGSPAAGFGSASAAEAERTSFAAARRVIRRVICDLRVRGSLSFGPRMRSILYLHGFASSPDGRKVRALKALLDPDAFRIVAPDLNVPSFRYLDFAAIVEAAVAAAQGEDPAGVVGSSLGALAGLDRGPLGLAAPLL